MCVRERESECVYARVWMIVGVWWAYGSVSHLHMYILVIGLNVLFFDCWWALFGNRAAEINNEGASVY